MANLGDEHPDGDHEYQDAFDHEVNAVLAAEGELLRQKAAELLATGSIAISRPAGIIRGTIRLPRWWRPGVLRIWSASSTGAREASSELRLGKGRLDRTHVENSVAISLAMHIVQVDA